MALTTESENVLSSGVDLKERKLYFGRYLPNADVNLGNQFDQVSVEYAIRQVHKMISDSKKPIEIHMNSYGGDVHSMLYLHDLILSSPVQFKFFGGGAIMSCATWIMAICDERYLHKNTTLMVHKGQLSLPEDYPVTDAEIQMEEDKRLRALLIDIYVANSRMPRSFWEEVSKRDLHLTADEAILFGLADKIIEPKKRGGFRKMRLAHLSEEVNHNKMKKMINKMFDRVQIPRITEINLNAPSKDGVNLEETQNVDGQPGQQSTGSTEGSSSDGAS